MAATNQDIAQALRYGPQTAKLVRRSQYLEDALQSLASSGQQQIRSPLELGTKLLATAILKRSSDKAQDATLGAIKADRKSESDALIASLYRRPPPSAEPVAPPQMPGPQASAGPIVPPMAQAAPQQAPQPPSAQPAGFQGSPQDRDAFIRMLATEAGGEGPQGMAAAGHVAMNRLKSGYGGANTIHDVVYAPHQFEGMSRANQVRPEQYAQAAQVADAILSGQVPDPTGGAVNFINPELQTQLGRNIPPWAQGQGQRIGNHVFFGGQPQASQRAPAPQQAMLAPPQPQPQGDAQPFQIAANGPLQPGMMPSASGVSPPSAGAPPAATPQAAVGGNSASQWPTYQPHDAEIAYIQGLLNDPRTFDMGRSEALKLQQKMSQPAPAKIVEMNGVQFYVPETPGQGGPPVMIPAPREAMTRNAPAEQFGVAAPRGTIMSADPYNNLKNVVAPPTGQQVASNPGESYRETFVPGSQNDPYRVQAPQQGYRNIPTPNGVQQQAIQGSAADLKSPANVMEGANRYGGMVKTIVDSAMKVKQNFGAVTTGYRQQNGTGDIAMINGLQKLIDEGVVKGEDVTMQMKSNGLEGTLGGWASYASSKGLLPPDVRSKVYKTANDLYHNLDHTYQVRVQSLQPGFDEAYGQGAFGKYVFPEAFAGELGWNGQPAAPTAPPEIPPAARNAFDTLIKAGKIDQSKPMGHQSHPMIARDAATLQALDKPENRGKYVITPDGAIAVID